MANENGESEKQRARLFTQNDARGGASHQLELGPNVFFLNGPISRLEKEALMRFESWTWWQRQGWRLRYLWARLRGTNT